MPRHAGIAKFKDRTFVSTANGQAGTPAYMAPELFDGKPVTEKVRRPWLVLFSASQQAGQAMELVAVRCTAVGTMVSARALV